MQPPFVVITVNIIAGDSYSSVLRPFQSCAQVFIIGYLQIYWNKYFTGIAIIGNYYKLLFCTYVLWLRY